MYRVDPPLPVGEIDAGLYFVSGAPLAPTDELALELLVSGLERGDNGLHVTANDGAESVYQTVGDRLGEIPENFAIVDAVSEQSGGGVPIDNVAYASSPADLTGLGMYTNEFLGRFQELARSTRTRVVLDSVSTLLMYSEFETVFRFLHVLSNRLELDDVLGLVVVNSETHEDAQLDTIVGIGDGVIEVREGSDGGEARVVSPAGESEWRQF